MSCYEWERGTFKLSPGAFRTLRDAIVKAHNAEQDRKFQRSLDLYDRLRRALPGPRRELVYSLDDDYGLARRLLRNPDGSERRTPLKPKRKDFGHATTKTLTFIHGECSVTFDREDRTVHWNVPENNHACEHARDTWLGRAFFTTLRAIQWTRGTGGTIIGNDEYNSGSDALGGGANYLKDAFGPLGRREEDDRVRRYRMAGWR